MLAVVKTPRTEEAEESLNYFETDFAKKMDKLSGPSDAIRIYRENRGLTQEELGKKIGVSKNYVSDWENGHRTVSKDKAKLLGQLFGISSEYFI